MLLVHEKYIKGVIYRFYEGADYEKIVSHSDKGLDGMMYLFIDVWEDTSKKLTRVGKLNSVLDGKDYIDIESLNNSYIVIYQCRDIKVNDMVNMVIKGILRA
jgi:hypothetical protein